jgi:hypothetical protein
MSLIRLLEAREYRYSHPGYQNNSPLADSLGNIPLLTNPAGSVNYSFGGLFRLWGNE